MGSRRTDGWKLTGKISKRKLDIPVSPTLHTVLHKLQDKGHQSLIVGGAVRDSLLGEKPKDIDVEVYGANYDDLTSTLQEHGKVNVVGKAFGVVKFTDNDKNEYDFSLPRRDNKAGVGHKDFTVDFDPGITPPEAAARRDFTFNALAYDPIKEELHDYHGGEEDLKNKVIRHTSEAFSEDPLRVLRGMQFSARFGMKLHPDTAKLTASISHEYDTIPKERVGEEFMKLATKGKHPGAAIDYLKESGWSHNFPQLHALHGLAQDPQWHPEGDVATHTKYAMDAAAKIADRDGLKGDDRAVCVFGAMAHDFGKVTHTQTDGPRITSHGHDQAGGPLAKEFLDSIGIKPDITDKVVPLVENHMTHLNFDDKTSSRVVRRLAQRLKPANITELSRVMEADHSGRPPLPGGMPEGAKKMLSMASESHVEDKPMDRLIQGRDVLPYFPGVEPGKHIGDAVNEAYEAQMNGEINTPDEAQEWLQKKFNRTSSAGSADMYHIAPRRHREAIQNEGLRADADRRWHVQEPGVYLFREQDDAEIYAGRNIFNQPAAQMDMWRVSGVTAAKPDAMWNHSSVVVSDVAPHRLTLMNVTCPGCGFEDIPRTRGCERCSRTPNFDDSPKPPGGKTAHGEHPDVMYHISPERNAESIKERGLEAREPHENAWKGVYLFDNAEKAKKQAEELGGGYHLYEVNTAGFELEDDEEDEFGPGLGEGGWHYVRHDVSPERITRISSETEHRVSKVGAQTKKQLIELKKQAPEDTSEPVHTFEDGWSIRHLKTHGDQQYEGVMMQHCLEDEMWDDRWSHANLRHDNDENGNQTSIRYSLRDQDNVPHVTFDYSHPGQAVYHTLTGGDGEGYGDLEGDEDLTERYGGTITQTKHGTQHRLPFGVVNAVFGRHNDWPAKKYLDRMNEWMQPKSHESRIAIGKDNDRSDYGFQIQDFVPFHRYIETRERTEQSGPNTNTTPPRPPRPVDEEHEYRGGARKRVAIAPRRPYYHVGQPGGDEDEVESITEHGIDYRRGPSGGNYPDIYAGGEDYQPRGNYLTGVQPHPHSLPSVWEVDALGMELEPDKYYQNNPTDIHQDAWYTKSPIPPDRIRRIPRAPADYPIYNRDIYKREWGWQPQYEDEKTGSWKRVSVRPNKMYHVAPASREQSIREHGLDTSKGESLWGHSVQKGNYLFTDPKRIEQYKGWMKSKGEEPHVWEVDTSDNENLYSDPEDDATVQCKHCDAYEDEHVEGFCPDDSGEEFENKDTGRWVSYDPIPPDRIKRIGYRQSEKVNVDFLYNERGDDTDECTNKNQCAQRQQESDESRIGESHYTPEEWDRNVEDVQVHGVRTPIHIEVSANPTGTPFVHFNDGNHRLTWAHEAGISHIPADVVWHSLEVEEHPWSRQITAAWKDVRDKGVRLRNSGNVHIINLDENVIVADVRGDHQTYHVELWRQDPNSWAISMWDCTCPWGGWAFKRQVTYVGRFCSHALATLYEAHGEEYSKHYVESSTNKPETLYHVTDRKNRDSILEHGINPDHSETWKGSDYKTSWGFDSLQKAKDMAERQVSPLSENINDVAPHQKNKAVDIWHIDATDLNIEPDIHGNYANSWTINEPVHPSKMHHEPYEGGGTGIQPGEGLFDFWNKVYTMKRAHIPKGYEWWDENDDDGLPVDTDHEELFHVAPSVLRDRIAQDGLSGLGGGIHAWSDKDSAEAWKKRPVLDATGGTPTGKIRDFDIWRIDSRGLEVQGDARWADIEGGPNPSAHFVPGSVPVERIKRIATKTAMAIDADWWDKWGPEQLYHRTELDNIPGILERGLIPQEGYSPSNQEFERLNTRPNHVYFHTKEPPPRTDRYHATFVVDKDAIRDPQKLKADEDWAESKGDPKFMDMPRHEEDGWDPSDANDEELGAWANRVNLGDDPKDTQDSINQYGTVAHEGPIERKHIRGYYMHHEDGEHLHWHPNKNYEGWPHWDEEHTCYEAHEFEKGLLKSATHEHTAMAVDPDWWEAHGPQELWHCTWQHNLPGILKEGLLPGAGDSEYNADGKDTYDRLDTRPNHLYFHTTVPMNDNPYTATLVIDKQGLKPKKMKADEDWAEQQHEWKNPAEKDWLQKDPPPTEDEWEESMDKLRRDGAPEPEGLGGWANRIGLGDNPEHTRKSIQWGTVAYEGAVAPDHIKGYYLNHSLSRPSGAEWPDLESRSDMMPVLWHPNPAYKGEPHEHDAWSVCHKEHEFENTGLMKSATHYFPKTGSLGSVLIRTRTGTERRFSVEVSESAESIRQGLMNRSSLRMDAGMVFLYPYPPSYSAFWMKNTLIPLSIAFWDQQGRIIEILDMEPCHTDPCKTYKCKQPYWGAIEVNKGAFGMYGVAVGDTVTLRR